MKKLSVLCMSLAVAAPVPVLPVFAAPVMAQEAPTVEPTGAPPEDDLVFPTELLLMPTEVQEAVQAEQSAQSAPVPEGMSAIDESYYRAQVAYATEDWHSARLYAETAAAIGHVQAATLVGLIERDGRTAQPDLQAAVGWFLRAAEQDEPVALFQLGVLAKLDGDEFGLDARTNWFERAARSGHIEAMVAYGLELVASPIPQDAIEGRQWVERSAHANSPEGMYQLAQLLEAGTGGSSDVSGARIWFERAARQRHAEAAFQAGMMWASGTGGEVDDVQGRDWLRISAESGYGPAMGQYGLMLYQGRGGDADLALAAYWFSQGAQDGDAESQFLYAYALLRGEGVTADYELSYRWVLEAATDAFGMAVNDPSRDQLQAGLERGLPADVQARIRAEVANSD